MRVKILIHNLLLDGETNTEAATSSRAAAKKPGGASCGAFKDTNINVRHCLSERHRQRMLPAEPNAKPERGPDE
jgi:hypothetical protein